LADAWQKAGQDAELGRVRIMKKSPSNPHTEVCFQLYIFQTNQKNFFLWLSCVFCLLLPFFCETAFP
jgi:hypothetical protein